MSTERELNAAAALRDIVIEALEIRNRQITYGEINGVSTDPLPIDDNPRVLGVEMPDGGLFFMEVTPACGPLTLVWAARS